VNSQSQMVSRGLRTAKLFAALLSLAALSSLTASAASANSGFKTTFVSPDYVQPGQAWAGLLNVQNMTDLPLQGTMTVKYNFPPGFVPFESVGAVMPWSCSTAGTMLECSVDATGLAPGADIYIRAEAVPGPTVSGVLHGSIELEGPAIGEPIVEPLELTVGSAPFAIKSLAVEMEDGPVVSARQAGGTPQQINTVLRILSTGLSNFNQPQFRSTNATTPAESPREIITHLPAGLVGNPAVTRPLCTAAEITEVDPFATYTTIPPCPVQSQVGIAVLPEADMFVPIWNVVPPPGYPAAFAFYYYSTATYLLPRIRPGDDGIDIVVPRASTSIPLPRTEVDFWGVPADSVHDHLRGPCVVLYHPSGGSCPYPNAFPNGGRKAFLRNPTSCSGQPLPWSLELDSYQHPGIFIHGGTTSPAMEGCEKLPFDPGISLAPSERGAHSPTGLSVNLEMPQNANPDGAAEADLRAATVSLPQGTTLNPASADGLSACTDDQLRLGLEGPSDCPESSKLGTLELTTPLLEDPVEGSVYLRSQASQDSASGDLYRLALELRSDRYGVHIKLPGSLRVDPSTGQLTTTFDNLPQLPFESMQLRLKGGPRAPLTTPSSCGTYAAHAQFIGWNGKSVSFDPSFVVDQGCTRPAFDPGFEAGVDDNTADEFSPFALRVTRGSGQPNLSAIDATLPEGELAKLAGVHVCGDAQARTGACPAASRIGSVAAGIGEGTSPLYLPQPGKSPTALYLAGPYKGAPYSVLAAVPAQAGPFDLGTVRVRSALRVDPETTQVTVASDPLPQIFAGIPVSYRDVRVNVDRPQFTLNPTDCEPTKVSGAISSIAGDTAKVSDRFQVADCGALGFKPKLSLSLKGKSRRGGNPALTAVLRMPQRGANIARTSVALPHSEFLAQSHLNTTCTRVQYNAGAGGGAGCPKGSIYGRAAAFSPLLDRPLRGNVYLRSNGGARPLPDLVASLDGQIQVDLVGYVDADPKTGGLRTTFARVPDAPVSKFVLKMPGGKKSLLENSTNICRGQDRARVVMDAQNGRVDRFRLRVRTACGKGARRSRSAR
jgi:hypothetical protein